MYAKLELNASSLPGFLSWSDLDYCFKWAITLYCLPLSRLSRSQDSLSPSL